MTIMKVEKKKAEDNLGKRQKALNDRVNQAVTDKVDFYKVKNAIEESDVDKLFKIDVAVKCHNSEYIIGVLKAGDSLHISRALNKCLWLYDEDHKHIVNPEYLHENVFPFMSNKMKKKFLTAISNHARTEKRAVEFYNYCMKIKLCNIAFKFFMFTSDEFKQNMMLNHAEEPFKSIIKKDSDYIRHLIGKSFSILEAFFTMLPESQRHNLILQFKYLYNVDNEKYLDLLEKHIIVQDMGYYKRFDLKLSKDIMTKHKERVLANPGFYEPSVHVDTFAKYTTVDDAKSFAVNLLPKTPEGFWGIYLYRKYGYFLNKIPHDETYSFIKKIFNERYPGSEFETTHAFYIQNYHKFMTQQEKEDWALRHLKSEKQILGVGRDYLWYQYVSFSITFEAIKKLILVTKEPEKRLDMINVVVKCARNDRELETLFLYYEKRHSNEIRPNHDKFLKTVIAHHNVFNFDDDCWAAFYKLLLNMELYNVLDFKDCNTVYKTVTLLYYILHEQNMNEGLAEYLLLHFDTRNVYEHLSKLNDEKQEIIYNYLFQYYINQIIQYKDRTFTSSDAVSLQRYNQNITSLLSKFRADTSKKEIVKRVYNQPKKVRHIDNKLSDQEMIRRLKTDTNLIKELVSHIKERFKNTRTFRFTNFLKKLRIYYFQDVAQVYRELFEEFISTHTCTLHLAETSVFGIFQLADSKRQIDFMSQHMPQESKIDYAVLQPPELNVQKSICRFMCYSRPPLPLECISGYLKGDYVKFCLKMFDMYLAHLPLPMCVQFVESIIDAPVSIQKHGIRLAFKCFSTENLKKIITKIWNKTKNVSLRGIIYKALYKKLETDSDEELFNLLKSFTLTLHQDDEDAIFTLYNIGLASVKDRGHYYEALWNAVSKFKDMQPNINRKNYIINKMHIDMHLINEDFIRTIVENHINCMLNEKNLHLIYSNEDISRLYVSKWKLTARYIIYFATFSSSPDKYVKLVEYIAEKCVESWNEESCDLKHFQVFFTDIIANLKEESYIIQYEKQNYETVIPVFQSILNILIKGLPLPEIYMILWDLRLTIVNRSVLQAEKSTLKDSNAWTVVIPKKSISLGKEIGNLVNEFVDSERYFASFFLNILILIRSTAKELLTSLNNGQHVYNPEFDKALLNVASGLLEHKRKETHLIAINLLPDINSSNCATDDLYNAVIVKIKSFPDFEVKSALYFKKNSKKKRYA